MTRLNQLRFRNDLGSDGPAGRVDVDRVPFLDRVAKVTNSAGNEIAPRACGEHTLWGSIDTGQVSLDSFQRY
jgi:hypothetical protein